MNCIKTVVLLMFVVSCNTLHSFVTQKSYEAWKKNIDDLNHNGYIPDAQATIVKNFILIEGGINYALVHKEAPIDLNNKIAGKNMPQYIKNSSNATSFLTNLFVYAQQLLSNSKQEFQKELVRAAKDLITKISGIQTRVQHLQKLFNNGQLDSIPTLKQSAEEGIVAITTLENILNKYKDNKYLINNINESDRDTMHARTLFEKVIESVNNIETGSKAPQTIEDTMTDIYQKSVTADTLRLFIQNMLEYTNLDSKIYALLSNDSATAQEKENNEHLRIIHENQQQFLIDELKTRIKNYALKNQKAPTISYSDALFITADAEKAQFLFDQLIEALDVINLTSDRNYEQSKLNFETLKKDFMHIGEAYLQKLCTTILTIIDTLWNEK